MRTPEIPSGGPRGLPALFLLSLVVLALAGCSDGPTDPSATNNPPLVDIQVDGLATAGALVTLDGSRSSDPDGDDLTYRWTQVEGPSVGTLAGVAAPSFTAPNEISNLAFQLVVNDGLEDSAPAQASILVVRDRNRAVFVSPTGTSDGSGSLDSPISSLSSALDRAASEEADLYLAAGEWDEGLVLRSGVSVFGGFDPADWSRDPEQHLTLIRGDGSASLRFAMQGVNVSNLTVDGVRLEGEQAGVAAAFLRNATGVVLSGISVRAPDGLDGADGQDRSNRTGQAPNGAKGENAGFCGRAGGAGGSGAGSRTAGGRGGNGGAAGGFDGARGGGSGGSGGSGGATGSGGSPGGSGSGGSGGDAGSAGGSMGNIAGNGAYSPSNGGTGSAGSPGRGGGGGGGGGGALLGLCGGGGGGGGAGGLGGLGGFGGQGGSASIAVLVTGGSDVRIVGSHLRTGGGGDGGSGGSGGRGEPGGSGGSTSSAGAGGGGGGGGHGGRGGTGGRGGGGGGGPSIGILVLDSQLDESGNTFEIGAPGEGGSGGRTGATGLGVSVERRN